LVTHALQMLVSYDRLLLNEPAAIWKAALTVAGFLAVATCAWRFRLAQTRVLPATCRVLKGQRGTAILFVVLALSTAFTVADHANWLALLPRGLFTAMRGFIRGLTGFAVFVLAIRWGAGRLTLSEQCGFPVLFVVFCLADISSLFLVTAITTSLMMLAGIAIGRRRAPWGMVTALVVCIGTLHYGKGEMRERHWGEGQGHTIGPAAYPALFLEWAEVSVQEILFQRHAGETTPSVFGRANTVDLLLQAQRMTPEEVPYLRGQTYAMIPDALIPRLFHAEKTSPHDSTTILNVYYGNQTWEDAQKTSIGWGMLNEAFANFGFSGVFGLALILGSFFGWLTRWSLDLPLTSIQALVGIFTMAFAIQTEFTAAIFVTAYGQGLFALLLLTFALSERVRVEGNAEKLKS